MILATDPPLDVLGPSGFPFEDLYSLHAPAIYGYVARRLGRDLADDLTCQVFVEAAQSWVRFDPAKGNTKYWLFKIATYQVNNHMRRERRTFDLWARSGVDPIGDDPGALTEKRLIAEERWALVANALRDFKPLDRDVVLLHCWADMELDHVAETLGIPGGTVRSRLARARRKLRKQLGDLFELGDDE